MDPTEISILEPFYRLLTLEGQRQNFIIDSFKYVNNWYKAPVDKFEQAWDIARYVYYGLTIGDDIWDSSSSRAGAPTAQYVFGNNQTVNCVNYMVTKSLQIAISYNGLEGLDVYIEQLLKLCFGQALEQYYKSAQICPSEEEFTTLIVQKTTGFYGLGFHLLFQFSKDKTIDDTQLPLMYGCFVQIVNDLMNLASEMYSSEKGLFDDIVGGTFSFPIIHAITSQPEDRRISNILYSTDPALHKQARQIFEKFGTFEYTLQYLKNLRRKILKYSDLFGPNDELTDQLDKILYNFDKEVFFI